MWSSYHAPTWSTAVTPSGPMNASGLYTLVLPVATSPSSSIAMLVR